MAHGAIFAAVEEGAVGAVAGVAVVEVRSEMGFLAGVEGGCCFVRTIEIWICCCWMAAEKIWAMIVEIEGVLSCVVGVVTGMCFAYFRSVFVADVYSADGVVGLVFFSVVDVAAAAVAAEAPPRMEQQHWNCCCFHSRRMTRLLDLEGHRRVLVWTMLRWIPMNQMS